MKILIIMYRALQRIAIHNYTLMLFKFFKVKYTKFPIVHGRLVLRNKGTISLGTNVHLTSGIVANPVGGSQRTVIICRENATIEIGDNTGISNSCLVANTGIYIGKNVLVGGGCSIYDSDFHSMVPSERKAGQLEKNVNHRQVNIKDNVFIGAHSLVLKGVTIGENAIIGAGSVVAKDIPSNQIWAGNPARFIKDALLE